MVKYSIYNTRFYNSSVFAEPESRAIKISAEDYKLFNTGEGLWFYDDNDRPVRATLEMSASDLETTSLDDRVFFYLYTRDIPGYETIFVNNEKLLKNSHYKPARETKFVTHGWISSNESKSCKLVREGKILILMYI